MFDLGGADAHSDRTEGAVGRGVAVAADHCHTRQGESELWTDDVDDALFGVAHRMQSDTELFAVAAEGVHLQSRDGVGDDLVDVDRRDVVVLGRDREVGPAHRTVRQAEPVECLRTGHLVHEM